MRSNYIASFPKRRRSVFNIIPEVKPFAHWTVNYSDNFNWTEALVEPPRPVSKPRVPPKDFAEALVWCALAKRDVVHHVFEATPQHNYDEVIWLDNEDNFIAEGVFFPFDEARNDIMFSQGRVWISAQATPFAHLGHTQFAWSLGVDGIWKELPAEEKK